MALKKLICIIDVGHGGSDSGAVGNGVYEKVANLNTALGLKAKLEKLGVVVYMTRTNDSYVSLEDRCSYANRIARENKDANIIFISVHHNAGGGDRGEVIHSVVRGEGEKLAHVIGNEMQSHLGQQKKVYERRGSDNRDYYYVIRNTSMTALIVEVAFLDNINDVQICDSTEEQIRNGEVIGCGIGKYFGLISNCGDDNKPTPPLTTDNLYRVRASWQDVKSQQGAYKDLNNAKAQADKTKLNVYDKDGNLVYSANSQPSIPTPPPPTPQPQGNDWVLRLQRELNVQGFRDMNGNRLAEDGISGQKTLSACPMLKQGAKGNITRLLQERLVSLGYNTNGVDGIFGNGTKNAVSRYQSDKSLGCDGIVGQNTWRKLLGL